MKARLQAYKIILQLLQQKKSLSYLLEAASPPPLSKAICFGVCRHYFRLQAIADCLLKKRPKALEVWVVLLMGLYQLHFMRKPDYAVVNETVSLLNQIQKSWAKAFINAVLRRFSREQEQVFIRLQGHEAFLYGHPTWLIHRLQGDWPKDWQAILKANDAHPPMSLRVNQQQIDRASYLACLQQQGLEAVPTSYSPVGVRLKSACDLDDLPGFKEGHVSVQDESAQIVLALLSLKPGLRVLDACCAPGGKTCHMLEAEPKLSACIALDLNQRRLQQVQDNLSRLSLKATLLQGDGTDPKTWWDGQLFDRILLDAPCSATGVIRRHPDIKLLRDEEDIRLVSKLQYRLLENLWPLLSAGGMLVYATCSVIKEENEGQIARFVANYKDCQVITGIKPWGKATGLGWQIFPREDQGDGFFYSCLRKADIRFSKKDEG